jgi:hypothetical protein
MKKKINLTKISVHVFYKSKTLNLILKNYRDYLVIYILRN